MEVIRAPWATLPRNVRQYLSVSLIATVAWAYFYLLPIDYPVEGQAAAFSPSFFAGVFALGIAGAWMSVRSGFPNRETLGAKALWLPVLLGLAYGGIEVARDIIDGGAGSRPTFATANGVSHAPFPESLLFYVYGSWFLESVLRVFWLSLCVWLVSRLLLRGRGEGAVFWTAAIIAALYEPMPYMMESLNAGDIPGALSHLATPLFLANLVTAWEFRRFGIWAPFLMRYAFYLVWHIGYGGLLYPQLYG